MILGQPNTSSGVKRLPLLLQFRFHRRKVAAAALGIWVVDTQAGLANVKGTLVQDTGSLEVALGPQNAGEVVEARGSEGMVTAKSDLKARKGPLVKDAGTVQVAQVAQDDTKIVETSGGPGMVRA